MGGRTRENPVITRPNLLGLISVQPEVPEGAAAGVVNVVAERARRDGHDRVSVHWVDVLSALFDKVTERCISRDSGAALKGPLKKAFEAVASMNTQLEKDGKKGLVYGERARFEESARRSLAALRRLDSSRVDLIESSLLGDGCDEDDDVLDQPLSDDDILRVVSVAFNLQIRDGELADREMERLSETLDTFLCTKAGVRKDQKKMMGLLSEWGARATNMEVARLVLGNLLLEYQEQGGRLTVKMPMLGNDGDTVCSTHNQTGRAPAPAAA